MKCIKRGIPPEKRVWIGDCYNCDSKYEALEGELGNIQFDSRDYTRRAQARCEVCNKDFWLYSTDIKNERQN